MMTRPSLSKAELRAQLEAAAASYRGAATARPEPEPEEPDLDDNEECATADILPLKLGV